MSTNAIDIDHETMAITKLPKRKPAKKTLSRSERAKLEKLAKTPVKVEAGDAATWAKSLPALAAALSTSRPTLDKWRKMNGAPKVRANGMHNIPEWVKFMAENGLEGESSNDPDMIVLRARKLLAEIKEKEFKLAVLEGRYADLEEVQQQWQTTANQVVMLLRKKFEDELPPICSGLDALGIRKQNKDAIDEVLKLIRGGK